MLAEKPISMLTTYSKLKKLKPQGESNLLSSEGQRYISVIKEFATLAQTPPGKDKTLANFYESCFDLGIGRKGNIKFSEFIFGVLQRRKEIKPEHFANLLFRGIQYIELYESPEKDYLHMQHEDINWTEEIQTILKNDAKRAKLHEILLTKNTSTTIYQRYVGPAAAINLLLPSKPMRGADFGCGANHGLRGYELGSEFQNVTVVTDPNELLNSQMIKAFHKLQVAIEKGLAIDNQDLNDPKTRDFTRACSFYPKELGNYQTFIDFEERLAEATKTEFLHADLLELEEKGLESESYDFVIISTVYYQLGPDKQKKVLETAQRILKDEGLVIINDFAETDIEDETNPVGLKFEDKPWYNGHFSYGTFILSKATGWRPKEIFRWNNGRCTIVMKGNDFDELVISPGNISPAA